MIIGSTTPLERKDLRRHPDEEAVLMAVGGEVIQLRAAVVPAVAYREREVVKHRDIYAGEDEARGSLQRVRQVDTARGLAEE